MSENVSPNCCPRAKEAVALRYYLKDIYESKGQEDKKPRWTIRDLDNKTIDCDYCPFCGKKLPEIRPRQKKMKVCVVTDGGYYCDTCGNRLHACRCPPPEFAWEPTDA